MIKFISKQTMVRKYCTCYRKYRKFVEGKGANSEMEKFGRRSELVKIFLSAVEAVNPAKLICDNVIVKESALNVCGKNYEIKDKNIYLVGFGKAVLEMAFQSEIILEKNLKRGVVSVPENIKTTLKGDKHLALPLNSVIEVHEGAKNNLPDSNSEKATDKIISLVQSLNPQQDILLVLISGGGSALFCKPEDGITLNEKLKTIKELATSGADISELNTIRKKLSKVKGGGLANLSFPVKTITLLLSDVVNDPLDIIASGPTVVDSSCSSSALNILTKYNLVHEIPNNVLSLISDNVKKFKIAVTDGKFPHVDNFLIGNNVRALNAAKITADKLGFKSLILSSKIEGLVQNVADFYTNLIIELIKGLQSKNDYDFFNLKKILAETSFNDNENIVNEIKTLIINIESSKKVCIIAGGETTVQVKGSGKGGRNQELALTMLTKIHDLKLRFNEFFQKYEILFLSAGTDGIDGPTDAAGAVVDLDIYEEAVKQQLNIDTFIKQNDSYNFYKSIKSSTYLIETGHTGTNVADVHVLGIYIKK